MKILVALLFLAGYAFAQPNSPTLTTIYNLGDIDPSGVIVGPGGELYGTGIIGGVVYSLTPPTSPGGSWTETTLSSIPNPSGLTVGKDGVLFGTSKQGGASCNCGTVFALYPPSSPGGPWTHRLLYGFKNGSDGAYPNGGLAIGTGGVLYGTTANAGGKLFSLSPPASPGAAWVFDTLYTFTGGNDGATPGRVAIGPRGALLGTTLHSGVLGYGTVYSLTPPASPGGTWEFMTLYSFAGGTDGSFPAGVIIGPKGQLFGTVETGGASTYYGAVFSLKPPAFPGGSWTKTTLAIFTASGGENPESGVVFGAGGALYGTTVNNSGCGLTPGCGTVFSLTL